jgi:tetratricopeptide (TPR) repeat protein
VSKQTLAQLLWPNERYGDFDRAINNIVSKLRRCLDEDSQESRCIQTIPKAGYRIQCPVSVESDPAPAEEHVPVPVLVSTTDLAAIPTSAISPPLLPRVAPARVKIGIVLAATVVVVAASFFLSRSRKVPVAPSTTVVGILPFDVSGDASTTGETLRGEIADAIAQIPNVQVRAAHSLQPEMARDDESLRKAARQLSLDLLLVGSLELSSDEYQLSLELVRGSDGTHIHSYHFAGPRVGMAAAPAGIENTIYREVAMAHGMEVSPQISQGSTQNAKAYDLAFLASQSLNERTRDSLRRAIDLYRQSISLDPGFARAYAGLAESYLVIANLGASSEVRQDLEMARATASKAVQLNPDDAQAHSVLGQVLFQYDWDFSEAERELRTAIRLNSGLATNHMHLAVVLTDRGEFEEAQSEVALAHELDPLWPTVYGTSMYVNIMRRQYASAVNDGLSLVAMRPGWGHAHEHLGWALWYSGKYREAIEEWRQTAALEKDTVRMRREEEGLRLLEHGGVRAYARAKLAALEPHGASGDFVPAEWHAFAKDRTGTLAALKIMVDQRDPESLKIPVNPAYDFLKDDPQYHVLVESVVGRDARLSSRLQ